MKVEILGKPSYSTLHLKLNNGEVIKAEPGSMVAMEQTAEIEGKMQWGFLGGLKRKFLTGESFFVTTITATQDDSDIYLAPRSVGDLQMLTIEEDKNWIVQWGGFLACTSGVDTDSKFSWAKWFFSGEGLFMIKVSWKWHFWVSSFGAIIEYEVKSGEPFIVDNSHIVAFEETLDYQIKKSGKWILNSVKTGEGLVCEFTWTGKLYIQTRNPASFAEILNPFLAKAKNSWGGAGLLGKVFGD